MRITHTYATLEISSRAYAEIRAKLAAAGYQDQFDGELIDMHGIAVHPPKATAQPQNENLSKSARPKQKVTA